MSSIPSDAILGESIEILAAKDLAMRIAPTEIPVLIVGETGTGKELLANYVHQHSRRPGHLVDVDCGALPDDLMESLLFGHKRGAFTGAVGHARGLIAEADCGTLFLDELSSLPERGQAKLLRVLETGQVRRVGETSPRRVTFRVVATAQESLGHHVAAGRFREDLVQRIAGVVIQLPSLAQRTSDIPLLARHFSSRNGVTIASAAVDCLMDQEWPGNVRQLKWTISRSALFSQDGTIGVSAVKRAIATGPRLFATKGHDGAPGPTAAQMSAVCRRHRGDPDKIAETLGIGRSTLYRRLKEAGLTLRTFRRSTQPC